MKKLYWHSGLGRQVECGCFYDSYASCWDNGQPIFPAISQLTPVDGQDIPVQAAVVQHPASAPAPTTLSSTPSEIHINQLTRTEIDKHIPGIRRLQATRIHERKPEGGYTSWEQLIEINTDLNVQWDAVRSEVGDRVVF